MNPYESPRTSDLGAQPASPKSFVILALVSLHISAVLYVLLGLILPTVLSSDSASQHNAGAVGAIFGIFIAAFCMVLAAGVEVVAYGIHKRRFWGWIAGLIVFGIYTPSLFFPLGVLGLWGLFAAGSRSEFGIGRGGSPPPPSR